MYKNSVDKVTCPVLNASSEIIKCVLPEKQYTSCNKPLPVGSIAYIGCKPFYIPTNSTNSYDRIRCMANGKWDKDIPKCKPGETRWKKRCIYRTVT
ncbi:hypothetical protein NQ314_008434 [Rhamnusium bicolor]|uniref:Sushi domain-containing protein n=1 Tax=Rhamnusium bicolor TaxID=1586634 RepID=A0AAV8YB56_9CUCU|nr:hypothetical protein NQ314_008434 [Rhamnusium bicolor]